MSGEGATARAARCAPDILAAALAYHARGWAPIPMPAGTKKPGRDGWQNERYSAETIPAAFADAGAISILCGAPSGGLLDVDPDAPEAAVAWQCYRPTTERSHQRPLGYQHDWYTVENPPPQTERLRDIGREGDTLIELRSTGGHTVVPPSDHEDGEPLRWKAAGEPAQVAIVELQRAVRHAAAAALLARHYPAEGIRHDYRLALAGCLLRGGLSSDDAARLMCVSARIAGADEHDAAAAVRDTAAAIAAGKRATGTPRLAELVSDGEAVVGRLCDWLELQRNSTEVDDSPPLDLWGSALAGSPPLDLGTLPPVLADFAADVAARQGCDPALVALSALGVCAGAIDDRLRLQARQHDTEWQVSARLWIAGLGEIGDGKSPALREAFTPLRAIDREWAEEDRGPLKRYALQIRAYNKMVEKWVQAGGHGVPPDEPARPPERCRCMEDFTTEALSDVLAENPGGVLIGVDELSGLLGSIDAYRAAGVRKDQPLFLELAEGGPKSIKRVQRGKITVPNWGASIVGGIQPERLRAIADRITDDGLLARFTVFFANTIAVDVTELDRTPNYKALRCYGETIKRLVALPAATYTMAPGAHRRREFIATTARNVAILPSSSPGLRAYLAKWEGLFCRVLLTWHLTAAAGYGEIPPRQINETDADAVARLMVNYFLPHAARLYGELLGQDHLVHARWIAGHILAHTLTKISARDIGRAYHELYTHRRALDESMHTLTLAGWVAPTDQQPGRAPSRWRVNPQVHAIFGARAAAEREHRERIKERIRQAAEALGVTGGAE